MARIQILELPTVVVGDYVRTPFALVIDQVETEAITTHDGSPVRTVAELTNDEADTIAQRLGAVGAILTACTLDMA